MKQKFIFLLTFPIAAALYLGSCTSKTNNQSDSAAADSLRLDSIEKAEINLTEYPDTVFPSAERVSYSIERADSSSGNLNSIADLYRKAPGAFTFRKGEHRDADFGGRIDTLPSDLNIDWEFKTREDWGQTKLGSWGGGTGWTGQPLYVEWPDSILQRFKEAGLAAAREEIFAGSLCGDVYFIDYATGQPTRPAINTGNPIKGTMSLDPTLNGNLYVGQGIPTANPVRALTIDLFKNGITHEVGPDPKAPRKWHAYDSSAIRVGQFLFRPGENGTLYKYLVMPGSLKLHSAMRYHVDGNAPGMEASMAVSRNYGFTGDNRGNIICVNLNTLKPVWHYKLPDDDDATPIVCEENGHPYIYVGCEVEHPGVTTAHYVKLDALTGERIWLNETPARRADVGNKHFDGGFYSTTLPGSGDCSDLLFVNVVNNMNRQNGSFMAIERAIGKTRYSVELKHYAWSSPVGFLTKKNELVVVTFDCAGNGYIFKGSDGELLCCKPIGANFESSPVVKNNTLVIGSRGAKIYRMSLR